MAVCLIALVLVQQGRGATMGAAFGSGASQTVFGARGSGSFLFRVTMSLIAVFFVTSIAMNYMVTKAYKQEKVITLPILPSKEIKEPVTKEAPASVPAASLPLKENAPLELPVRK